MKGIEITTAQNVTVQYGLATVFERSIAFFIDATVITLVSLLMWFFLELLVPQAVEIATYFTIIPFIVFYSLAFEQLNNGQSIGKMSLKIRVIRMDGEKVNFIDYFMRWVFRVLDIYSSLGGIATLAIVSSSNSQRIGDLLADTVVVNVAKSERMKLENLLKLNNMENYRVSYPQVVKMSEEAMLIVKETLTKVAKHNNFAHQKALDLLVDKLEKELELEAPKNKLVFLKTLLKDYIVLTR